jgi:hypothetical protein
VKHHHNALLPKLSYIPERSARKTLNQSIQALYQLGHRFTNVARLTRILKLQGSIVRNSPGRCLGDTFSEQISVTLHRHASGGQNSVPTASCTRNTFKKGSVTGHRNTRLGRILSSSSSPKSKRILHLCLLSPSLPPPAALATYSSLASSRTTFSMKFI